MWGERLKALRERPLIGLLASLTIHLSVIAALLLVGTPFSKVQMKRGEPLFVELPDIPGPAPAGNPAARSAGPPIEQPSRQAVKPVPPSPSMAKPAPPTPSRPAPRPSVVASRPVPPEPPRTQPTPPRPAPPAPPADAASRAAPEAAPATPEPTPAAPPPPSQNATLAPSGPPEPQVAALPPQAKTPAPVDIRSALRRGGGAGGTLGDGRGGITGEPIGLDSPDPRFQDYLMRVKRQIEAHMANPCVKNSDTRECEVINTDLVIHFGILKNGQLRFAEVVRGSPWSIYDDYSMNALKLAQPFPPIPPAIMAALEPGSTGMPITGHFVYRVTVRWILR